MKPHKGFYLRFQRISACLQQAKLEVSVIDARIRCKLDSYVFQLVLGVIAVCFFPTPAAAAVTKIDVSGTIVSGTDSSGYFTGTVGGSLATLSFDLLTTIDDSYGTSSVASGCDSPSTDGCLTQQTVNSGYMGDSVLTINSKSFTYGYYTSKGTSPTQSFIKRGVPSGWDSQILLMAIEYYPAGGDSEFTMYIYPPTGDVFTYSHNWREVIALTSTQIKATSNPFAISSHPTGGPNISASGVLQASSVTITGPPDPTGLSETTTPNGFNSGGYATWLQTLTSTDTPNLTGYQVGETDGLPGSDGCYVAGVGVPAEYNSVTGNKATINANVWGDQVGYTPSAITYYRGIPGRVPCGNTLYQQMQLEGAGSGTLYNYGSINSLDAEIYAAKETVTKNGGTPQCKGTCP